MNLLVICLGNICRSPMAEGALRHRIAHSPLAGQIQMDSAGTGDWHVGQPPDPRAIACAHQHGVDIAGLRARQVCRQDFETFDWLLCADQQNLREVRQRAPAHHRHKVELLLHWSGIQNRGEIPDPYTGGPEDFQHVWRLVDRAAQAALQRLASS